MKFRKVNIEITNICNLQCSFCPEVVRTKELMPVSLFEKVLTEVAPLTQMVALHLMGDPLVHPELDQFIQLCEKAETKVFLVSNGVLLREKEVDTLLHPAIRQISFSLHSFSDNFPGKDPLPYLERIFSFTERAFHERPDLFINYRLWNLKNPKGTGEQNQRILKLIENRFQFSVPKSVDVRIENSVKIKKRLSLHFDTEFIWPALDLPILGHTGKCHGLSSHFGILVDGTVVPCCLDKEGKIPLGNLQTQPLRDILRGVRAQNILRGFKLSKLVEDLCQRCQYIQRFEEPPLKEKTNVSSFTAADLNRSG